MLLWALLFLLDDNGPGTPAPPAPPVANFTATPLSGDAPLEVTFTDTSTESPTSWFWDFGDGNTSTSQNPVHEYNIFGTVTVTLTATNADGSDTEIKENYITILNPNPPIPGSTFRKPLILGGARRKINSFRGRLLPPDP
jgi:PKD repeat protein